MAQMQMQPYNFSRPITKSDTVNFDGTTYSAAPSPFYKPKPCEAIYVGGAGVLVAVYENGQTENFTCVAGQTLLVKAIRVNSTNTTASLMVELHTV